MTTYGFRKLTFTLPGISRSFSWTFQVADVLNPILGADFLSHHRLLVDCFHHSLIPSPKETPPSRGEQPRIYSNLRSPRDSQIIARPLLYSHNHSIISTVLHSEIQHQLLELLNTSLSRNANCPEGSPIVQTFHTIPTVDCHPYVSRPRELAPERLTIAKAEFEKMQRSGVIRASSSPWAAPLHMVAKKDGSWRPCGDFRGLNRVTIPDAYPMPLVRDLTHRFANCSVFTKLDLEKAYYQIPMRAEDIEKTAVTTPFGLFEFLKMPFGLRNAAQTFQRHMDNIFREFPFVAVYIDDIIIASKDTESHRQHCKIVFDLLAKNHLSLNSDKCSFATTSVIFLGHVLSTDGFGPDPKKLKAISEFPTPTTVRQIRSFCGMINFYHRFIPHCSEKLAPLSGLITIPKDKKVTLTPEAKSTFNKMKFEIMSLSKLAYPLSTGIFSLTTDASNVAAGAVLHQEQKSQNLPIAFYSHKFSPSQSRFSAFDRELLAIFMAVKNFEPFLITSPFKIFTDHKPLIYMFSLRNPSPRQQHQLSYLSQFNCTVYHIKGSDNVVADTLSRCLVESISHTSLFPNEILISNFPPSEVLDRFKETLILSGGIAYDNSLDGTLRPILVEKFRKPAFNAIHNINHPGFRGTFQSIQTRVVWPHIRRDVKLWCKECPECQKNKVTRHLKPALKHFPTGALFENLHLDIVGPLISCEGKTYMLTMLDRKSRWPEVVPLRNISASTVARHLVQTWFSRYGVPKNIITDQGTQFESDIFKSLSLTYGFHHARTTAYHPQSNGLIERFHRALKSSLRCHSTSPNWVKTLPLILLGWRNTLSRPLNASPAQVLFGCGTALPVELVDITTPASDDDMENARNSFRAIDSNPLFTESSSPKFFIPKDLSSAKFVWLKSPFSTSLSPFYTGPFKITARNDSTLDILVKDKVQKVNLARVKPAFGWTEPAIVSEGSSNVSPNLEESQGSLDLVKNPNSTTHKTPFAVSTRTSRIPRSTTCRFC